MKKPRISETISKRLVDYRFEVVFIISLVVMALVRAQCIGQESNDEKFSTPENLVAHLYDQVTFPSGESPDWKYIRTLFDPSAIVVMRQGISETATLSLDGWILDFVNFIHDAEIETTGFQESIVKMESTVFGDIAHILVLYTSYIPGISEAPREGVDSFHLIKKDARWRIISILNEIPNQDRPIPEILR